MALISKFSQQTQNNKPQQQKFLGIVILSVSMFFIICQSLSFPKFISNFSLGVFGLISYALFTFLSIIAIALIKGKKLIKNVKYFTFVLCSVICVFVLLHILLTSKAIADLSFTEYISYCYNFKNTIGGVLIGAISYLIYLPLKLVGSCVLIAIMLIIFIGLSVDSYLNFDSNIASKGKKIKNKIILNQEKDIALKNEKKQPAKTMETKNSLNIEENKQRINLSSENSVVDNTYYKPKCNEDRKKYILTPPSMEELYHLSKRTDYKDNPFTTTIANTTLPSRPSRNPFLDEESIQRNRDFLKSTYPSLQKYKEQPKNDNPQTIPNYSVQNTQTEYYPQNSPEYTSINSYQESQKPEEDLVNFKLEELKNNINLNVQPLNPPSSSRASLLNSTIQNIDVPTSDNVIEEDNTDYGNIHNVETVEENFNLSNRFEEEQIQNNRFNQSYVKPSSYMQSPSTFDSAPMQTQSSFNFIKPKSNKKYVKPPIDLLNTISSSFSNNDAECQANVTILEQTLDDFRIPAKVRQVTKGPAVTRYEIQMPAGISVKKVQQHAEDIAMALSANGKIRIEAPIPGKNAVGIEVPNREVATIGLRDVIDSENFNKATSPLTFALGKDITGEAKVCDLRKLTHMLVAGTTGSGKSVCLNALIISMMYKASPEDLRFILVDPKRVEFSVFNGMPHLMLPDVISEPEKALNALTWCIKEMERRYGIIEEARVKNLKEYNETQEVISGEKPKLPLIVLIVDELADLMMFNKREVEDKILKLAQKSRAAGIHLVLATQRPSVDVITGTIKGNLPSRIAFAVTSFPDSKTILDCGGAERLLGRGDMLYAPQELPEPVRLQGAFISNGEVEAVVDFIKENNDAYFDEETSRSIVSKQGAKTSGGYDSSEDYDDYFTDALRLVIENGSASGSFIQRRLGIGYNRAGRIMDQMEREKFIAPSDGSNKPRAVYITMEEFERRFNN